MRNAQWKNKTAYFLAALFFLCCEVSVERKKARLTGTAERNKVNDRRETFCLVFTSTQSVKYFFLFYGDRLFVRKGLQLSNMHYSCFTF